MKTGQAAMPLPSDSGGRIAPCLDSIYQFYMRLAVFQSSL
jgi:hypothetical protein